MKHKLTIALVLSAVAALAQERPSEARRYRFEPQEVTLQDFAAPGYILDIGGGGEGIIGRLKPKQVIAIDLMKSELEEAPAGPLKIIMDARELKFLDGTFPTATAFYCFMYIDPVDHEKVFREAFRVLARGGKFLVWDFVIPTRIDPAKDVAVFRITVKLPGEEVKTGYGTLFRNIPLDLAHYVALAEKTGFQVLSKEQKDRTFRMELVKR